MTKKEIIKQLNETSYWITEISNHDVILNESNEPHIKDMLDGIQNAVVMLSSNTIEVDISFYHPNDDETIKVYDVEGMREEFEYELNHLINGQE